MWLAVGEPACRPPPKTPLSPLSNSVKIFAPLQVNASNLLILPQEFFDVLHDLLITLGLHIHKDLLTRICKQEIRGEENLRTRQDTLQPQMVVIWNLLLVENYFNNKLHLFT